MAKQLLTIQVARGVAANLVALSHLQVMDAKYAGGHLPAALLYGISGVDVFFVLSGFIMVAVAGRQTRADEFLFRRALRIYPSYWLVSLAVLAASIALPGAVILGAGTDPSLWKSLLLIPQPAYPLLAVGWTLVHEMYFYLVFALLLLLRVPIATGLAIWLGVLCLGQSALALHLIGGSVVRLAFSPLTLEFMLGAVVGLAYLNTSMRGGWMAAAAAAVGIVGVGAVGLLSSAPTIIELPHLEVWRVAMFGVPAALVVYALAAWEKHGAPRPPQILVGLGDWSYATYLLHVLVLSVLGRLIVMVLPGGWAATALFVVAGLIAINLAGGVMTRRFERPLLGAVARWRGRKAGRPQRPEPDDELLATARS